MNCIRRLSLALNVVLAFGIFAANVARAADAAEPAKLRPKVLFLGIDGCRFDAIEAAKTPHLDRLMKNGIHSSRTQILGKRYKESDTVSGPGWSSILTGVWADKHGVHNNKFKGKNYERYPHLFTLLKQGHPRARTVSLVTWGPIEEEIVSGADVSKKFVSGDSTYEKDDALAAAEAVRLLGSSDPDLLFLYLGQVDETGHQEGFHPSVAPYVRAIERVDALIGDVLSAIEKRSQRGEEDWLVIVTSDHGGQGKDHSDGHRIPEILNSFLIVSGRSAERGEFAAPTYLVDAPATALAFLGVKADPRWELDGRPVGLAKEQAP
jgi:predicted AlkP superfamily pyrophosphatase or phosphodiesterase